MLIPRLLAAIATVALGIAMSAAVPQRASAVLVYERTATRFVSAQDAGLGNSVRAFVTVLVGGAGTLGGPILGSALVSLIERVVPSLLPTDLRISDAILGIIFIAFVLFARQGMVGLGRFALLRVSRR